MTVAALFMERYFEVRVLAEYFGDGDVFWFCLTIAFLWGQGFVLGAAILYRRDGAEVDTTGVEGEEQPKLERFHNAFKLLQATLALLTCPLVHVLYHIWMTILAMKRGDIVFEEMYDTSRKMRSLRSVAENAPQMLLQLYIVIIRTSEQGTTGTT